LLNARIPAMRNQAWIGIGLFVLTLWLAWEIGGKIAAEDLRSLEFAVMGIVACAMAVTILRNWRSGFYLFLVWMLFEDLPRKYLGNGTLLFFGKDVLVLFVYIALLVEIRRGREKTFRPPFLLFFSLFLWLGVVQVFNQNSPSILYGLLGFKLDFFYMPLIFVGYALIRNDNDLRKFLLVNGVLAGLIAALGIIQAIVGNSFLNPAHLAPELEELGNLQKSTPLSNRSFSLPDSIFVSSGRFAEFLIVAFILALGTAGYLFLSGQRGRKPVLVGIGIIGVATLLSGSRGAFLYVLASALVLTAGLLWGAPWRWKQAHRLVRAIRRTFIVAALGLTAILVLFPDDAGSRIAYYAETLSPYSSAYEAGARSWDYPIENLLLVFAGPNWVLGNGIGTASLGTQYVAKLLGRPPLGLWVEEGYGVLIVEMGLIAPFLWILWTAALVYYSWKVVLQLRQTRFFPIGFAILWYAFLLLFPITFAGLSAYQNFVTNAYLWLLTGILFRLPNLLANPPAPAVVRAIRPRRGGFQF
jgi:hypothetical protein